MGTAEIIGMIGVPLLLLFVINSIDKEHIYLKLLLMFFVFDGIFLIGAYVSNTANTDLHLTFFRHTGAIIFTFALYILIYFIYSVIKYLMKSGKLSGWKK